MSPVRWRPLAALCGVALAAASCGKGKPQATAAGARARGPVAVPVETATVGARDVERVVTAAGSLEAFELVQVTARVQGAVERVSFREGDEVAAGLPLVEIEPSRFRIALDQARARLARAEAALAGAEAGAARREAVNQNNPGLIRGDELETFRTAAAAAAADLAAARASVAQAELNLKDAHVRAPVRGVIQTRTVQTGQYVQPGSVLATVVRKDPLLLRFQVPEQDAASLSKGLAATFVVRGARRPYQARVTLVAGTADAKSRLVQVTAEVTDAEKASLRPGTFAQVNVPVGGTTAAPVIPQTAIRPSERGFLAYVVEGDKARERVVELGLATTDGLIEVKSGLDAGARLVVRGAEALRDGATVRVANAGAAVNAGAVGARP